MFLVFLILPHKSIPLAPNYFSSMLSEQYPVKKINNLYNRKFIYTVVNCLCSTAKLLSRPLNRFTQAPDFRGGNTSLKSLDNKRPNQTEFLSENRPTCVCLLRPVNKLTICIIKF